jgi:DNA-binding CsgD family transcriptional regulator
MNFKKVMRFTYNDYLHNAWFNKEITDEARICHLLDRFRSFSGPMPDVVPAFFVLDYSKKKYSLVTDGIRAISKYDPRDILEGGLDKYLSIYHREDFQVYSKNIFPANLGFLGRTDQKDHHHYVFSNTYRINNKDKSVSTVLQKSSYITSKETGLPLFSFGSLTDISHIASGQPFISHFVERKVPGAPHNDKLVMRNRFYIEGEGILTPQEKNILGYLSEGCSSKMISEKLKISVNTVNNHRQNILNKTNCRNVAQLIVYGVRNNLL